jgi:hypothetical protein
MYVCMYVCMYVDKIVTNQMNNGNYSLYCSILTFLTKKERTIFQVDNKQTQVLHSSIIIIIIRLLINLSIKTIIHVQ